MSKDQNKFGAEDTAPEPVTLESVTKLDFSKLDDVGEEIDFEDVDQDDDPDPIEEMASKMKSKLEEKLDDDFVEDEELDTDVVDIIEESDESEFMAEDFLDVALIVDLIDDARQSGYPVLMDKVHQKDKITAYRKKLGRKQKRTDAEQSIYLELEEWEEKYSKVSEEFSAKIPWSEKFKTRLTRYLDVQLKAIFQNTKVPTLVLIGAMESILLARILFAKGKLPDLDFEIPDLED